MRSLLFMILSVFALDLPMRLHAASTGEADARRAQVAAANADAVEGLRRDVLSSSLTPDMTVEQFVQRTDSRGTLDKTVRRAEQIGGTRWLDDQTCQVRLQLPGSEIADAIVEIAKAKPRETGIPADVIRQRVDKLRERTFAATGMSTGAIDRLRPRPEQAAWRGVPDADIRAALNDARRNAASQVLASVEPVALPSGKAQLQAVLADPKVRGALESWLINQPVTSAEFQDDLEVRVGIAPDADAFWNELKAAGANRKELGFPTDADARDRLRLDVMRRIEPTVGRAFAKGHAGVGPGAPAPQQALMAVDIPRDPPRWIADQIDVSAPSKRVDTPLKTARAAESAARDKLRNKIEELKLSSKLTLGDAAKRDNRVRAAIDRVVRHARPRKVSYLSDGGAEVTFSLDLREVWYELVAR
jgi:hypothetical protein